METESKIEAIERRMAAIERTARRWRLVAVVAVAAAVCCFGMAADDPFPKIVRANVFEAVDENGNVIGKFGCEKRGGMPNLVVFGPGGKVSKNTAVLPAVVLFSSDGKSSVANSTVINQD